MSSLLDEAIVDAKALREAVLKSAEASLLEAYAPKIQEAVEQMLEQDEMDPLAAMGEPAPEGAEEETGDVFSDQKEEDLPEELVQAAMMDDEDQEIDFDLSAGELRSMMESVLKEVESEDETSEVIEEGIEIDEEIIALFESEEVTETTEEVIEEAKEDADPDELSDEDVLDTTEPKHDDEGSAMQKLLNRLMMRAKVDGMEPEVAAQELGLEDDPEVLDLIRDIQDDQLLDNPNMGDLDGLLERLVVDIMPQKSGWAGTPESVMKHNEKLAAAMAQSDEYKEERDELLKVGRELAESNEKFQNANTKLMETVETLEQKLNETNLSNAKLLYTNRILRKSSLNERQKETIVEALSNAGSVNEAKVIFETLQSTVGSTRKSAPQSLSEAVSRPSSTIPRRTVQSDFNPFSERMRLLAGINKK